jgi:hypothetical protein
MGQLFDATGRPGSRLKRISSAAICLLLAAASAIQFNEARRVGALATHFEHEFSIDVRWPWVKATGEEPVGDLAADIAVEAALRDVPENVPSEALDPNLRQAWQRTLSRRHEELQAGRDLILAAIATRPGWAYHKFLLANVVLAAAGPSADADRIRDRQLAAESLRQAARSAPGLDAIWVALGNLYSRGWEDFSAEVRHEALQVWRRAFLDSGFVSREFLAVVAILGRGPAIDLLPDAAIPLQEAARRFSLAGDLEGTVLIATRISEAQRKDRAFRIHRIEETDRLGDTEGLRSACLAWASAHPVGEFDDRVGRAQDARILELWPADTTGSWRVDPRANLVRYFLNRRASEVKIEALARAVASLSGTPDSVRARLKLLGGDRRGAEEIADRTEKPDPLEWAPYFVELARFDLKHGEAADARRDLERSAEAQGECDLLLARREIARALRDETSVRVVQRELDQNWMAFDPQNAWSAMGTLSVCVDPERLAAQALSMNLTAERPALVDYGADGGRSGSLVVGKSAILSIPLYGLSGSRTFEIETVLGGPARVSSTVIQVAP